jgi:hypothetical protein
VVTSIKTRAREAKMEQKNQKAIGDILAIARRVI